MFVAPRVGTDVVVHFEDAAEVAASRKPALLGNGIELEVGERQQSHGSFEAHPRERGLRAFVPRLPEEAAQVADGDVDGLRGLFELWLLDHVFAVPRETGLDLLERVVNVAGICRGRDVSQRDQGEFDQRLLKKHQALLGHTAVGRSQLHFDLGDPPDLGG